MVSDNLGKSDSDEAEEEYALAPSDAAPPAGPTLPPDVQRKLDQYESGESEEPEPFQFTLAELMLTMVVVSVLCSLAATMQRLMPGAGAEGFAGLLGIATLAAMVILAVIPSPGRGVQLGWWCMVGLYLLTCVMALLKGR